MSVLKHLQQTGCQAQLSFAAAVELCCSISVVVLACSCRCREGFVLAQTDNVQADKLDDSPDEEPGADDDLLQWSDALDYDSYTR